MSARTQRRSRRAAKRPRRWLALAFGLVACGVAFWVLLDGGSEPPLGEIDAASRAELERVLERADGARAR
ncbi:MAG: hypothetical protein JRH16_14920 [Deltaproteobacteria bacterium]|nr:hypothetical protein [Deltaproteobacteria bacterium]MBW2361272.1 hypothetical protein [Deltaproteobacteria bacterium]